MPNPQSSPILRRGYRPARLAGPAILVVMSLVVFGSSLSSEPHFVDESAYISQSFYADLLLRGLTNDPAWLEYAGYDLPPLPKYLIGLTLRAEGYRRPPPASMWAWYRNTKSRFVSQEALTAARHPSVILGAMGCLAIFAIGTIGFDRRVGFLSALLLMANPLYRMHARRAMSDVPTEAMILASLAVGLWAWKRAGSGAGWFGTCFGFLASGVLCGLATLSKLNGALAGLVLAGWAMLAMVLPWPSRVKSAVAGLTLAAGVLAFGVFVALNPFLTARPPGRIDPRLAPVAALTFVGRVKAVADHRVEVSHEGQLSFPKDALPGIKDKVEAVAIQGFGRFSPFGPRGWSDSTHRFEQAQDWGAWIWLPLVTTGFVLAVARGRRQAKLGQAPTGWAVALQVTIAMVIVTAFIPLAWDRYYLSIQPGSAILASLAIVTPFDVFRRTKLRETIL